MIFMYTEYRIGNVVPTERSKKGTIFVNEVLILIIKFKIVFHV